MPLLLKFSRKALNNVDDAAGRWQFEGGSVTRENRHVANYASVKRVTFHGTDQDGQNTASVTTTIFSSAVIRPSPSPWKGRTISALATKPAVSAPPQTVKPPILASNTLGPAPRISFTSAELPGG